MARAHRHYLPGIIWHITQRCHKKEFLLKFKYYRKRWLYWLYIAKHRFGICILDYIVTSNHIHLLALSDGKENEIAKTMHLVSGRTAWEFNHRRKRRGAFWEDRYHATAVDKDNYLIRCMVYIDTNMVRAGAVAHPVQWPECGYQELIGKKKRYNLINKKRLMEILQTTERDFMEMYHFWVDDYIEQKKYNKESCWTKSIAIGSQDFVETINNRLGVKARGRRFFRSSKAFELRETGFSYLNYCPPKKRSLRYKISVD